MIFQTAETKNSFFSKKSKFQRKNSKKNVPVFFWINIFFLSFLIFSCTTMADFDFSSIDYNVERGNFNLASEELESSSTYIYSDNDLLLYNLDKGILSHFDSEFKESNISLTKAEKLCVEYAATSITQSIASAVTNDTVMDYSGEAFEDIYTNIFMALNYIHLGNIEDAMVEVRRFDNKLRLLEQKYEKFVEETDSSSEVKVQKVSIQFSDSALARYLSMLLYRTEKDFGNAEVDLKLLKKAFAKQKSLYDFKIPSTIDEELNIPKGKARLNIIAFSGNAPVKKEEVIRAYWSSDVWYKLALPVMEKRGSDVNSISVTAKNLATGKIYSRKLEKIESIENIALDTFKQSYSLIYAKSLARSIARAISNSTVSSITQSLADESETLGGMLLFSLIDISSKVATEVVERADVRCSRYFPANASVCGLNVEEGNYEITVNYYTRNRLIHCQTQNISIEENKLNLVESACLR